MSAAYLCELCGWEDCLAARTVTVPTDDTLTRNPELHVGVECVPDACRYLEGLPEAIGFAQVDPLSYAEGLL